MAMEQIEILAKEHAAHRALLAERVQRLNNVMQAAQRRLLPGIKTAVSDAKDSRARLRALIGESRAEFVRPKTRVLHGLCVGFKKGPGKLTFSIEVKDVIKRIQAHFAERFAVLVKTTQKPVRKALLGLSVADLKKIGCEVTATGDKVVLEPIDSEVDKLVSALLDAKEDGGDGDDADGDDE